MTEKLSRQARRALARSDQALLEAPLTPGRDDILAAHLRHIAGLLRGDGPVAALRHLTRLFEDSVPPSVRATLACRSGCAFCCQQRVGINAPEAFALAAALRGQADMAAAFAGNAAQLAQGGSWPRCAVLGADNACNAYEDRPLSCHGFVSLAVADCIAARDQPAAAAISEPALYGNLRDMCRMMMHAALRLNGHRDANYEMNAAMARALSLADGEARWRAGEDVFAGLPVIALSPHGEGAIARLTAAIAPTV